MGKKKKSVSSAAVSVKSQTDQGWILWAILLVGLAIKSAYFFASQASPFFEPLLLDPAYYHEWAKRIAAGNLIDPPVFYGLPLYPFFLGFCYKVFGGSLIAIKLTQIFLGMLTLFLTYKIGEKLFSKPIGFLAAGIGAWYAPLFFHEQVLIPEALGVPLYAAAFYLICLFEEAPTFKKGFGLGGLLGLAALTKANAILFLFVYLTFWLLRRRDMKSAIGCFLAFWTVLAPVTAHNVVFGKDIVFLSSHAGFNFYAGNHPKAEGVFSPPEGTGSNVESQREDAVKLAEKALGRKLKPSEVSKYWSDRAMDFIRDHPGRFLELCAKKFILFFDAREISDVDDLEFSKDFVGFLRFPWFDFSILGPLFFLGIAVSLKTVKHRGVTFLWMVSYLAGLAAFFVNARYRLPLLSVFFVFAAAGLAFLYRSIRTGEGLKIFVAALILSLGVWVSRLNLVGVDRSVFCVNAGDAFMLKNEPEKAAELYRQALEINPSNSKASVAMGLLLTKLDRPDDAEKFYRDAISADPSNSQAQNNLGLWYDGRGMLDEAERCFLKAIELKPASFQGHNNLGMIYGKRGMNDEARLELEKALEINPRSARALTNLGLVHYRQGQKEKALELWKKALEIDPDFELAQRALRLYEGAR